MRPIMLGQGAGDRCILLLLLELLLTTTFFRFIRQCQSCPQLGTMVSPAPFLKLLISSSPLAACQCILALASGL